MRQKYTPEDIIAAASRFKYRSDWKKEDEPTYDASFRHSLEFRDKATAHMTYKASPYSGAYVIYVYEFSDRHAYVGLTFKKDERKSQHLVSGPVFEYSKVCPTRTLLYLEEGLPDPTSAAEAEIRWIKHYQSEGWTILNVARGGSLGTFSIKWSKQDVLDDARKYQTRKAWFLGSQYLYSLAKKQDWFAEAVSHMPRKASAPHAGHSPATRARQAAAKQLIPVDREPELLAAFLATTPLWTRGDLRTHLSSHVGREVSLSFLHAFMRRHSLTPTVERRGRRKPPTP